LVVKVTGEGVDLNMLAKLFVPPLIFSRNFPPALGSATMAEKAEPP